MVRNNSHMALLFVDKDCQLRVIAGERIRRAVIICSERDRDLEKITVNSSPNAYATYCSIGFRGEKTVKTVNGIQFIPMELDLDENGIGQSGS